MAEVGLGSIASYCMFCLRFWLLTVKIRTQNERPTRVVKILVSVKEYVARSSLAYALYY